MSSKNIKNLDIKYVIIISDQLENYLDQLIFKDNSFKFIITPYKSLNTNISRIKNVIRENLLIIINKEFYNDEINGKIKSIFSNKLTIQRPHFLFLNTTTDEINYFTNEIEEDQNFFFPLNVPKKIKSDKTPFYFFLKMIFQRTRDISRLENYIINAFRTIVDAEIINRQKQEIEKLYNELDELSKLDYLTKVLNRRAFFDSMNAELNRTKRKEKKINKIKENLEISGKNKLDSSLSKNLEKAYANFSCIMIDLDHFKKINDNYGHLAGDQVLKELGELLKSKKFFRDNDIVGRYGGEEFIVILPETSARDAKYPVERLRESLKKIQFRCENNTLFNITISIGISEFKLSDKSSEEIISRADKALYYAKKNGRDQIVIYEDVFNEEEK